MSRRSRAKSARSWGILVGLALLEGGATIRRRKSILDWANMLAKISASRARWCRAREPAAFPLKVKDYFPEHPASRYHRRNAPSLGRSSLGASMAYVVTESCIKCKYTDCVDV